MPMAGISQTIGTFNPRTHEGCDGLLESQRSFQMSFNPRTHEGCDIYYIVF